MVRDQPTANARRMLKNKDYLPSSHLAPFNRSVARRHFMKQSDDYSAFLLRDIPSKTHFSFKKKRLMQNFASGSVRKSTSLRWTGVIIDL